MDWPYHFPHPADVIAREAEGFRRLSPEERCRAVMDKVREVYRQLEESPNRAALEAEIEASERAWQEAHRRIFRQFGF